MSEDGTPVVNRTRRRLYEDPVALESKALEPEVLPPLCRESPLDIDKNSEVEAEGKARLKCAQAIVSKYTTWSAVVGVVPLGWAGNSLICGAVNVQMIKDLCDCYGREFKHQVAVTAVTAVIGAMINACVIKTLGGGLMSLIPGWGALGRLVTSSTSSGSVTYLSGRVFVYHFELGGTLFGLDATKTKAIIMALKERGEEGFAG